MVGQSEGAAGGSKSRLFRLGALYRIGRWQRKQSNEKAVNRREKERERENPQRETQGTETSSGIWIKQDPKLGGLRRPASQTTGPC